MKSESINQSQSFYLLTNGIVALEYLRNRTIVPASLRVKDASYTDLSNVAGNKIVLLNSPEIYPELLSLITFEGAESFADPAITMPVLFEVETNLVTTASPNNIFTVIEGKVLHLSANVTLHVADNDSRVAFLDFLNRYPGESDDEGISIKITRGLLSEAASDAYLSDIEWLKDQKNSVKLDNADLQRFERIACSIALVIHNAGTQTQIEAAASLVGVRIQVQDDLLPIIETRNHVTKPTDRLFRVITDLVLAAPIKVDPKALAVNFGWIPKIRETLNQRDKVEKQLLDDAEKFLKSEISFDEIVNLEKSPALRALLEFLRDSGALPKYPDVESRSKMEDSDLLKIFLIGLNHSRNELELAYRRPLYFEAYLSNIIAESFNDKEDSLKKSAPGFNFELEENYLSINDTLLNAIPALKETKYKKIEVGHDDLVWEVVTQGKVQVRINGMLANFDSPTDFYVVFTSEPTVKARPRIVPKSRKGNEKVVKGDDGKENAELPAKGLSSSKSRAKEANRTRSDQLGFDEFHR